MAERWRPRDSRLSRFFRDVSWKKWSVSSFLVENDASSDKIGELYQRFRDDMTLLSEVSADAPAEVKDFIEGLSMDTSKSSFMAEFHATNTQITTRDAVSSAQVATCNLYAAGANLVAEASVAPRKPKKISAAAKGKGKATTLDGPTEDRAGEDGSDFDLEEFEKKVEGLDKDRFWKLQSGRCVENIIVEAARKMQHLHILHSLIVYTEDKETKNLFTEEEWKEICDTNPVCLTNLPEDILAYLGSFKHGSVQGLHDATNASYPFQGEYVHHLHWDFRWVRTAVETWLGLYCEVPSPLTKTDQNESFWRNDVFGVINSLMRGSPNMPVVHGEITLAESAQRRNQHRGLFDSASRNEVGFKTDGLFQVSDIPPANIGVVEAGKTFGNNTDKKSKDDSVKLMNELHDMLRVRLKNLQAVDRSRDLVLVGHLISGPVLQTMYASSPGGYVVRIGQHHGTFKVASTIEGFPNNIRILTHLLRTKQLLVKAKRIMEELPSDLDSEDTASTSRPTSPLESRKRRVSLPPLQEHPSKRR